MLDNSAIANCFLDNLLVCQKRICEHVASPNGTNITAARSWNPSPCHCEEDDQFFRYAKDTHTDLKYKSTGVSPFSQNSNY